MEYFYVVIDHPRQKFISKTQENESVGGRTASSIVSDMIDSVLAADAASFRLTDNNDEVHIIPRERLVESFIRIVIYNGD